MSDEHFYCSVCNKVMPFGTIQVSVSVMRERFIPDDGVFEVEGMASVPFSCHEACTPEAVRIDLSAPDSNFPDFQPSYLDD